MTRFEDFLAEVCSIAAPIQKIFKSPEPDQRTRLLVRNDTGWLLFLMRFQRETLVGALREMGVSYLVPSDAVSEPALACPETLLRALLRQPDSRLQLAIVPLFLRNPTLASCVPLLVARLDANLSLELRTLYMAAAYLQRHWQSRLGLYLDDMSMLPDLFSEQMGLPSPEERFGKTGLYELADAWQARSTFPFARLEALNRTIDLFFEQLKLEKAPQSNASTG